MNRRRQGLLLWCLALVLWASFPGAGQASEPQRPEVKYDVRISDGPVTDYTLQALQLWKVDDEEGVARIRRLNPPAPKGFASDVAWFSALRLWMRERSRHGPEAVRQSFYPPLMLEKIRGDMSYSATCGPFSVAYAGLLLSFDVPVRLVHVFASSEKVPLASHAFTEVWSEDLQKWVAQDVDKNLCWTDRAGKLMNAWEVQDELTSGKPSAQWGIVPRRDAGKPACFDEVDPGVFHRLVIAFQSNYFRAGSSRYLAHQKGSLVHLKRATESEDRDKTWRSYKISHAISTSTDPNLFYAPVNQISIRMTEDKGAYRFALRNNILNFGRYQVREGSGDWKAFKGDALVQEKKGLGKGRVIAIRGVSKRGHLTRPAVISFALH